MKILIVCYYDLIDYLFGVKKGFEELGLNVDAYPLFKYAYDTNDKLEKYENHMQEYINKSKPEIILWWFIDVPLQIFEFIKKNNRHIKFIMYNADDPYNLNEELIQKSKIFDLIFTSCNDSVGKYILFTGNENVYFNQFGTDREYYYNGFTERKYDIGLYLYNFTGLDFDIDEFICNIQKICLSRSKTFNLYGPAYLRSKYSDIYVTDVSYASLNNIYNEHKYFIVLHGYKKDLYINELVGQVLSSNTTLITNCDIHNVLLKDNIDCIKINKNNYQEKIAYVLDNNIILHSNYKHTWDDWARKVYIEICKKWFNQEYYRKIYDISLDIEDSKLFDYWEQDGLNKKQICMKLNTPKEFNYTEYSKYIKDNGLSCDALYYHWYVYSQNEIFLTKQINQSRKNDWPLILLSKTFNALSAIRYKHDFVEIIDILDKNPAIEINDIIKEYLSFV